MTAQLHAVRIDAHDSRRVAEFWGGVLGWDVVDEPGGGVAVIRQDGVAYRLTVQQTDTPKPDQNRIHFDLTSASQAAMDATIVRALELGGQHIDIGQTPDDAHVVLADPEGNELCVIEPGSNFLADTGVIGAVNCDGSQAVGYFWSKALEWPLVWDQDEETAIQSPAGGSKITWSGPPLMERNGRDRLHLDLSVASDTELEAEVERLTVLGASRTEDRSETPGAVTLIDPDGNEFQVLVRA
ncbi:VOC family protein [Knoellia sp. CPCC 206453]|uniref:VOC family protein n=1 Tax=Knoellia pratensis TaxID=3404796 RepID=UPI00360764C9